MKKYRCTICGYIYDEAIEKVKFSDLPDDWQCPLCGAPKSLFEELRDDEDEKKEDLIVEEEEDKDLRSLSNYEISLICSNLARGCEKQYMDEEHLLFLELANYFEKKEDMVSKPIEEVKKMIDDDINKFEQAVVVFDKYNDRGAKRVATWANKTTNIMKTLIDNYKSKGLDYIKNNKIWVCDICGFVFVGDNPPQVCPICKVPNFKILEVE